MHLYIAYRHFMVGFLWKYLCNARNVRPIHFSNNRNMKLKCEGMKEPQIWLVNFKLVFLFYSQLWKMIQQNSVLFKYSLNSIFFKYYALRNRHGNMPQLNWGMFLCRLRKAQIFCFHCIFNVARGINTNKLIKGTR